MANKKSYIRQSAAPSVEDLEKTAAQLNLTTQATPPVAMVVPPKLQTAKTTEYSYTIKLDADLERRVDEATKKHRQTKKGFFLSAIEERLEKLGY